MKKEFNVYQNIGFIFQAIISMFVMFSVILTSLTDGLDNLTKALVGLMFAGLAFNNHFTFKRKGFTVLYIIITLASFWSML